MAAPHYRSTHIPLSIVRDGPVISIIPNRADAVFNLEANDLRQSINTHSRYVVTQDEEFSAPTIAWNVYRNHQYWWVICLYNAILDPTSELWVGRELFIPDRGELQSYLAQSQVQQQQGNRFVQV